MKNVGLVTFWDYNYGSSLQCYATKNVIKSFGYRCDLIEEKHTGKATKYKNIFKKLFVIPYKILRYPGFFKAYCEMRKHAKTAGSSLSEKTRREIHFFGKTELQPKELTRKTLKRIGNSDDYVAFITGSDQVWGGHFVEQTYGNFLEFAPKKKRISYAASFGSNKIANYNVSKYRKGVNGIKSISVREDAGVEVIKQLTGQEVVKMPDPTILLSIDEWLDFSSCISKEENQFILVHFLDSLSNDAINTIKLITKQTGFKVICLGWKREELSIFENSIFVDGDPRKYISLIRDASFICTDSFHTTLFSLRFKKQFYTFPRQYIHSFSQAGRLSTLLKDCNCLDRYIKESITSFSELPLSAIDCSNFFETERKKGIEFLKKSIKENETASSNLIHPNLKEDDECTGCGVCVEKCPKNAISMQYSTFGYKIPNINSELCINCGICDKYCNKKITVPNDKKEAYIAYNMDTYLLNKSASGGVFSAIAKKFIENGGVVYGAAFDYSNGKIIVRHRSAKSLDDLYPLLQSKYVQSDSISVFKEIENNLINSVDVLFSGTSCQVESLYRYLGKEYDNLYTLDLICHGVPGEKLFNDYLTFLETKNKSKIVSFSFREKIDGKINYIEHVKYDNGKETRKNSMQSDYYKMFFNQDSYRESCYNCPYASINKPSNITVGDYFECENDYPELFGDNGLLNSNNGVSCLIIHNKKGKKLIKEFGKNLKLIEANITKIQDSHDHLCFPSIKTDNRYKMIELYSKGGFSKINHYNKVEKIVMVIPNFIKCILKKFI